MTRNQATGLTMRAPYAPGQLRHLEAELAAFDRRLRTRQFNVSNHRMRAALRRWRRAVSAGMTKENAFELCWYAWFFKRSP